MNTGRMARALCALLAVAVLAACARIPLSGTVMEGQDMQAPDSQGVQFLPNSPVPGASQAEVVQGFLEAGTGTQSNYATARSYLVDGLSGSWDPTERVLVHDGSSVMYTLVDELTVRVDLNVVAQVDANGVYTSYGTPQPYSLEYDVQRVEGEWRVSAAEQGLVLMSEWFMQVFEPYTVYFYDSTFRYLVPDVRWFPGYTTAPTRIVQAILDGPSSWLAEGSVRSAFPPETVLRGPVTTEDGTALADFSAAISSAASDLFPLMLLQVTESLSGVTGIGTVMMSANGATIDVDPPPDDEVHSHAQVNATPLVYRDGEFGFLSGETITPPAESERLATMLPNLGATRGTVSVDQGIGAFLTPRGVMAIPFLTGQPVAIDARESVAMPSIDPFGFVWTVASDSPDIHVSDISRQYDEALDLGEFGRDGISSLQVSRDGARVVALVRDDDRTRLVVAAIERTPGGGEPTGIGTPVSIPLGEGGPIEVTWVDETSIAILSSDGQGSSGVRVQQIGGDAEGYGAVENGAQIAGSNSLAGLRLVDAAGNLFVPRNSRWMAQGTRIDFLVTQA
ncbi:hypothetical protein GCM10011490_14600 [Pseudoclavibacter endophyticus]|uniref:GerMN domain-containing protein n=1 Tax=Pseudoclavibacter endophyticus TaxID=1778590 RepID=A0A6H9WMB0_9MICO|nr:LpqB family beta-propeller domain-containing protein [Pseudoclavibacter endophyticus]KAB1649148.1 hypothetical protein F8O04_02375 [Pseudoclavibacter endophyticus]GGA65038.1 hypothetical protein GCM10011490_14600 [Pseudoclavibacter endophyticus]